MSRFYFLEKSGSELYDICTSAETAEDIDFSMLKTRKALEHIVDKLNAQGLNLFEKISYLSEKEILNNRLTSLFHDTRKLTNEAVHYTGHPITINNKFFALNSLVEICLWYAGRCSQTVYSFNDFEYNDLPIAKKYVVIADDILLADGSKNKNINDPFSVREQFHFNNLEEENPLERSFSESMSEYKERIANMPPVHIGYALLDTSEENFYPQIRILQHNLYKSMDIPFTKNKVYFYTDQQPINDTMDGRLMAPLKVYRNKICYDYNKIFLQTDSQSIHLKMICWQQLEIETLREYEERIDNLPKLPVAMCKPIKEKYILATHTLPFEVKTFAYALDLPIKSTLSLFCTTAKAKEICQQITPSFMLYKPNANLEIASVSIWHKNIGIVASADSEIEYYMQQAASTQIYREKVDWYQKAAEQGLAEAQLKLGLCYDNGLGVLKNYTNAIYWYKRASEQGYYKAKNNLACTYVDGHGCKHENTEAINLYKEASLDGSVYAQYNLGTCFLFGYGVNKNPDTAFTWYKKAAENGMAQAQFKLGNCYAKGIGVQQNYESAAYWYQMAAEQNNEYAQVELAKAYTYGEGVTQDYSEALYWLQQAAEKELSAAQRYLGLFYEKGYGVNQNYPQAERWYRKAAEQGDVEAQLTLVTYYKNGYGVRRDDAKAAYWQQKATESRQSYPKSLFIKYNS